MKITAAARAIVAVCVLLAAGTTGCTMQEPAGTEAASAAPQLKPGEVRVRMNGQLGWYGGVSSNGR